MALNIQPTLSSMYDIALQIGAGRSKCSVQIPLGVSYTIFHKGQTQAGMASSQGTPGNPLQPTARTGLPAGHETG
jgi:hypothetical protein